MPVPRTCRLWPRTYDVIDAVAQRLKVALEGHVDDVIRIDGDPIFYAEMRWNTSAPWRHGLIVTVGYEIGGDPGTVAILGNEVDGQIPVTISVIQRKRGRTEHLKDIETLDDVMDEITYYAFYPWDEQLSVGVQRVFIGRANSQPVFDTTGGTAAILYSIRDIPMRLDIASVRATP